MPYILASSYFLTYLAALFFVWSSLSKKGYDEERILDWAIFGSLFALLGGRLVYVFSHLSFYSGNLREVMNFGDRAITPEGFVFSFAFFTFILFRYWHWPIFPALDFASTAACFFSFMIFLTSLVVNFYLKQLIPDFAWFFGTIFFVGLSLSAVVLQKFYSSGRLTSIFLLSTLRLPLALTGVILFFIIEGGNLCRQFYQGFKTGIRSQLTMKEKETEKQLKKEEARLEEQISRLEQQDPKNRPLRTRENAPEEETDEAFQGGRVAAIKNVIFRKLRDVKISLIKLRSGSYGVCDRCGKKIDPARLKAVPDATYCLECEKEMEQKVS